MFYYVCGHLVPAYCLFVVIMGQLLYHLDPKVLCQGGGGEVRSNLLSLPPLSSSAPPGS